VYEQRVAEELTLLSIVKPECGEHAEHAFHQPIIDTVSTPEASSIQLMPSPKYWSGATDIKCIAITRIEAATLDSVYAFE
jgi:hypothetical protein